MSVSNSARHYGSMSRALHWATALLILTAFPIGLYALNLPLDTAEELARKTWFFSLHKTLGVSAFFVALARILWAFTQTRPQPLHPERKLEVFAAETVHWSLYIALVAVPLSGWIHHAAVDGFAPIWWPFGQNLPLVPKSETLAVLMTAMHWLFTKVLLVSLVLHIVGAVKYAVIDRDATIARMTKGTFAGPNGPVAHNALPLIAALVIWLGAIAAAFGLAKPVTEVAAPQEHAQTAGNWQVNSGTLQFIVRQMGSEVTGQFGAWTAEITFDETAQEGKHGNVEVSIDTTSLTLGTVTDQAKGKDFFDSVTFATAIFKADILPDGDDYTAAGALTLRGLEKPVSLPFTLQIEGDTAQMQGETTLDRRDFEMGVNYKDESSVGFSVKVKVDLTATRSQ